MKTIVKKIDNAIRDLYRIEVPFSANDFMTSLSGSEGAHFPNGTLLIQEEKEDLSLGIYIHPTIQKTLVYCETLENTGWTSHETNAFATATEEISHFIYLVYQARRGRSVSQFELELQGEIDKFLVLFFTGEAFSQEEKFESLFETLFQKFHWHPLISKEEQARYEDANTYAKKFVSGLKPSLCERSRYPDMMRFLRDYYRLSTADKIGYLHKL